MFKPPRIVISFLVICCLTISSIFAQSDTTNLSDDLFDMNIENLLNLDITDKKFQLYGYINANVEKVFHIPSIDDATGNTVFAADPMEWSPVKNFHLYGVGNISEKISYQFNLARAGSDLIEIRNAWGNYRVSDRFQIRVGKMYRKFGLYNEKLDQVPTFIGIEPPEMLDGDHLFLTRTTTFMVHGVFQTNSGAVSYALTTGTGEGGPQEDITPLGWDLRYKGESLIFGTSGYTSSMNGDKTGSTVGFGEGSPDGGILPWMAAGHFTVFGLFLEKQLGNLNIQTAFWNSSHQGIRDPANVLTIVKEAGINASQRSNFLGSNASKANVDLTEADVVTDVSYDVKTWYIRLGYSIQSNIGQFVPYVFADWMSSPETIQSKSFGGDNETGFADDGKFFKPSIGVVYRPVNNVAIKLDASSHIQDFNGKSESYPEIRLDFSFAFK